MSDIPEGTGLLEGRVALVTGAAGGIGAATAKAFARHGATLALTDRRIDDLERVAHEIAGASPVHTVAADVTSFAEVQALVREVEERFGGLDVVANVAGGPAGPDSSRPIEELDVDAWQRSLALNLSGPFHLMKAAIGPMRARGGGAIVTIGSLASIRISTHAGAGYTAAKSGVLGLTRHAAFEFARDNVRVNAVLPGIVNGALMQSAPAAATKQAEESIPLGRMTSNEEVANAVLYLSSDLAAGVTGEYLVVDGGMQIGSPTSSKVYFEARAAR